MFNLVLACVFLVVWAAASSDLFLTLAWFNLAVWAASHIADAIKARR